MSTERLPDPMVPPEVDLGGYEWMPLYGDKLLNSETWVLASAEAKVAALTLWWQSYAHQRPAGSLPNNDRLLADAAGYGVAVAAWKAIKEEALRGWVLCSDGRLYHPVVAKLALQAWETRLADIAKKDAERARKKAKRNAEKDDTSAGQNNDVRRTEGACPPDTPPLSDGTSAGIPPENALKGKERTGKERSTGIVESSAGGRPPAGAHEAGRPADGLDDGISAIRQGLADGFERWFDLPDRPISPADGELFADWIAAGAERGLSPSDTAAAVVEEVQRQFRQLAGKNAGPPRSLRAVLDRDVRTAIAHARPARSVMSLLPVPEPYAGHFDAVEWHAWLFACRITTADGIATVEAPTTMHRDRIAQHLAPRLMVALGVRDVEVTIATGRGRSAA
ncbi:hypothetical protein ACHMW5_02415 [Azospirillum melinis]|uniref:hypothetical protein n=1 Tax=Azospirillum melinis TaxID=328839 RepID=UPI003756CD99